MLKICSDIPLEELEKFGFVEKYIMGEQCYVKEYKKDEYCEYIYVWGKERNIQAHAIDLLDTLYELIQARYIEMCKEEE